MKILFYSTKNFEIQSLKDANTKGHELFFEAGLLNMDSLRLARGMDAVSVFTSDDGSAKVIEGLAALGLRFIAIRATGYDNIDLAAAAKADIRVANVPAYSPNAIAEHAVTLLLALNRKILIGQSQIKQQNYLLDRLVGFDLYKKQVGIIGTGKIGAVMARIMHGFGCRLFGFDQAPDETLVPELGLQYVDLQTLCSNCDIISLHLPLCPDTKHIINKDLIGSMKEGVFLINTARGALVHTDEIIAGIESGRIGAYGADVYEGEKGLFFFDHRGEQPGDARLSKLLSFENVLLTPHQGFATREALQEIAATTFYNLDSWASGKTSVNELVIKYRNH